MTVVLLHSTAGDRRISIAGPPGGPGGRVARRFDRPVREMKRHSVLVQMGREIEIRRTPVDVSEIRVATLVVSGGHHLDYFWQAASSLARDIPGARHV